MIRPYLLGLVGRLLGPGWPQKSASELHQKTLVRAWEKFEQFVGGQDDDQTGAMLRAWLAKIMYRLRRNEFRDGSPAALSLDGNNPDDSTAGVPGHGFQADESTPSARLRREEEQDLIQQALGKLGPRDREIVRLKFFEDRPFREIGELLDLDESTVRYHFQCVLGTLGRELKGLQ